MFLIISFLIVIHEIGHTLIAYLFKGKIECIYIYPLGGISKFSIDLNIEWYKEFLILLAGPLFQFIAYFLLIRILPSSTRLIYIYHYSILWFNLLPIYPLDGGKLTKLFLDKIIPYKKSLKIMIDISYFLVLGILLYYQKITINLMIMTILLWILITKEKRKIEYTYNKFLLERYLKKYSFPKKKIITKEDHFYREKSHILKIEGNYYLEEEYLQKKYQA